MRIMVVVFGLLPATLAAQSIKVRSIAPADARLSEEFTSITSVRELSDGRVILTDPNDKGLVVADFRTGKTEPISRKGNGPGEYTFAFVVRPIAADSSLMAGPGGRWLLLDGPRVVVTLPPDAPVIAKSQSIPQGTDNAGHIMYFTSLPPKPGISITGKEDSLAVVLMGRASARADTVAYARAAPTRTETSYNSAGKISSINVRRLRLMVGEQTVLFRDGWLAIVRIEPYRVDWRAPTGQWTRGAPLPVPLVKITDREKHAYMERSAQASGNPPKSPDTITDWPETFPPFAWPGNSALAASDGRLLIVHEKTADHPETVYDIVNRRGALEGQLALPASSRIVGFGKASVYIAVTDDDGIQRLERHPWK